MPLQTEPRWRNPCFFTSWITAVSVQQALAFGQWPAFGLGPLLVLLSSLVYWRDPQRETWRRTLDLLVVRVGMASHVLLALLLCRPAGVCALLGGYACGGVCYAVGRVLTPEAQPPKRVLDGWGGRRPVSAPLVDHRPTGCTSGLRDVHIGGVLC